MQKVIVCFTVLVESSPQAVPLGSGCIASSLKQSKLISDKYDVEIVSISREEKDFSVTKCIDKICCNNEISFFLPGIYVWNRSVIEEVCAQIKKRFPNCIIIGGGPECTANPFGFTNIDYVVAGQGEDACRELIEQLILNPDFKGINIQGVYAGALCKNCKSKAVPGFALAKIPDLQNLSSPYLDGTLELKKEGGALWELARGCPFKCSYCYESKGEKKIHYFPQQRLEKELELFAAKEINQVFVLDPTYNANKERALELLKLIKQKAPGIFFYFEARAEFIDRNLAKGFAQIPCSLQIGLQSCDEEVLQIVHRGFDKQKFLRGVNILNQEGVNFGFDLIYGLPGDSLNGFKKSIDFALGLYPNNLELFPLSVLPGTDLYDRRHELKIQFLETPPYSILGTEKMGCLELEKARVISFATRLFYTQGRAVPWFNTLCRSLKCRPSQLCDDFAKYLDDKKINNHLDCSNFEFERIMEMQIDFVKEKFLSKNMQKLFLPMENLIKLNGAFSCTVNDGSTQTVNLNYHPQDLFSEYATDLNYFAKNVRTYNCKVKTFAGNNGPDWKIIK